MNILCFIIKNYTLEIFDFISLLTNKYFIYIFLNVKISININNIKIIKTDDLSQKFCINYLFVQNDITIDNILIFDETVFIPSVKTIGIISENYKNIDFLYNSKFIKISKNAFDFIKNNINNYDNFDIINFIHQTNFNIEHLAEFQNLNINEVTVYKVYYHEDIQKHNNLRKLLLYATRFLYWWDSGMSLGNFGDLIGPYLFKKIRNEDPFYVSNGDNLFYKSVGSILGWNNNHNAIVWGSGFMKNSNDIDEPYKICSVRGNLTYTVFNKNNIKCPEIYGDPALLLPLYFFPINIPKRYKIGLIPHFSEYSYVFNKYKSNNEVTVINFSLGKYKYYKKDAIINESSQTIEEIIENTIQLILQCEKIVSSSLHGIICSHAYSIPVAWVAFKNVSVGGGWFKYIDYFKSVGLNDISLSNQVNIIDKTLNTNEFANLVENFIQPSKENFPDLNLLLKECPFNKN